MKGSVYTIKNKNSFTILQERRKQNNIFMCVRTNRRRTFRRVQAWCMTKAIRSSKYETKLKSFVFFFYSLDIFGRLFAEDICPFIYLPTKDFVGDC